MKRLLFLPLVALFASSSTYATDNYDYKPGEYPVVDHGLSPDKRYSIAAHGGGDLGYGNFHIYLMDVTAKKKIGPLTEISDVLDTGPDAFHAEWAPDSRHVAITYRVDRHQQVLKLYRIEDRRAFPIKDISLFDAVAPHFDREAFAMTDTSRGDSSLKWKGPKQFILMEESNYFRVHPSPKAKLGKFVNIVTGGDVALEVYFSAEALCELTEGDGCKIISLKPGKF